KGCALQTSAACSDAQAFSRAMSAFPNVLTGTLTQDAEANPQSCAPPTSVGTLSFFVNPSKTGVLCGENAVRFSLHIFRCRSGGAPGQAVRDGSGSFSCAWSNLKLGSRRQVLPFPR